MGLKTVRKAIIGKVTESKREQIESPRQASQMVLIIKQKKNVLTVTKMISTTTTTTTIHISILMICNPLPQPPFYATTPSPYLSLQVTLPF
jgi:hypothetical protein